MFDYKNHVGEEDPNYGGIIIDLRNLPIDTGFHVANGNWSGCIIEDENGVKCVLPYGLEEPKAFALSEENAYLSLDEIYKPGVKEQEE